MWWYPSLITAVSWSTINEIAVASTTKALDSLITHNQGNVFPGRQFITCTCLASFGWLWFLNYAVIALGNYNVSDKFTDSLVSTVRNIRGQNCLYSFVHRLAQTFSFKAHDKTMHTAGTSGFIYSSPVSIILL